MTAWRRPGGLVARLVFCAIFVIATGPAPLALAGRTPAGETRPQTKKKSDRKSGKKRPPAATEQSDNVTTSQPADAADGSESVAAALGRLAHIRRSKMTDRDIALQTGLEFVRSLGRADGQKAAGLLEAIGYQTVPTASELPEEPGPPMPREAFATEVAGRKPAPFDTLPASCIELKDRKAARLAFPTIGTWMLPSDWAVVLNPVAERPDWVRRPACIVIRVRAGKPTIQGGDVLTAFSADAADAADSAKP